MARLQDIPGRMGPRGTRRDARERLLGEIRIAFKLQGSGGGSSRITATTSFCSMMNLSPPRSSRCVQCGTSTASPTRISSTPWPMSVTLHSFSFSPCWYWCGRWMPPTEMSLAAIGVTSRRVPSSFMGLVKWNNSIIHS